MAAAETTSYEPSEPISEELLEQVFRSTLERYHEISRIGITSGNWFLVPRSEKYDLLESRIGNTPIVRPPGLSELENNVRTKLEWLNPSGSHYDRAYLSMLREFEEEGLIRPGDELRDITSGSAGISLAMLGHALGYKVRITVPDELPATRTLPMRFFGAEIIESGTGYIKKASEFQADEIRELKDTPGWELARPASRDQRAFIFTYARADKSEKRVCYLNHSENALAPEAFKAIGEEAVSQLAEAPESILLAMGNWTTIAGISPVVRRAWPGTRIIGYEGENTLNHDNYGTTVTDIPLRFRDNSLLDEQIVVTDWERDRYDSFVNGQLPLGQQLGHSSIMGLAAADARATSQKNLGLSGIILTIGYDQRLRY